MRFKFGLGIYHIKFKKMNCVKALSLIALLHVAVMLSLNSHQESVSEFCWKDSFGRGVGTIPDQCGSGRVKIGLLCYSNCPDGYQRSGFDCHQKCPTTAGWSDQGLFCRLNEYGRGAGYPWKPKDGLSDNGMKKRCQKAHGSGNCEKDGAIFYPKCRDGYDNFGCCICRPKTPNCNALGFNGGIDLSCAKKIKIGDPVPMSCGDGEQKDGGLCYKPCKSGYKGVGPVCWGGNPTGWVGCGMGSAKTQAVCAAKVFGQVTSAGNLAFNIATLGAGKSATAAQDAAKVSELKAKFQKLKQMYDKSEKLRTVVSKSVATGVAVKSAVDVMTAKSEDVTIEDIVRVSAQIAGLVDPTGVADTVAAYTYPKCDKINV